MDMKDQRNTDEGQEEKLLLPPVLLLNEWIKGFQEVEEKKKKTILVS